jgi:hypothetical protein
MEIGCNMSREKKKGILGISNSHMDAYESNIKSILDPSVHYRDLDTGRYAVNPNISARAKKKR